MASQSAAAAPEMPPLIALEPSPPQVSVAEAERLAAQHWGVAAVATPLAGERDRNFRLECRDGRSLLLKFLDATVGTELIAAQDAILAHLAEQAPGLPVPRVHPARSGAHWLELECASGVHRVRLLSWVPGVPARESPLDAARLHGLGRMLGRIDRALAGFFHPALGQALAWDVRHAARLAPLAAAVGTRAGERRVRAALERMAALGPALRALPAQALHADGHADNLLLDPDTGECTGLIDFGDCVHGPRVLEPAVAMADFLVDCPIDPTTAAALLSGYVAEQPLEPEALELLPALIAARAALKVVVSLAQARHRGEPAAADARALALLERLEALGPEALRATFGSAAAALTPGTRFQHPDGATLLARRHRALGMHAELSYARPLHLVRGAGVWVWTDAGERLLDVYNNVPHVGHAHPRVADAVAGQLRRIATNTRYLDLHIVGYAERLAAKLPSGLEGCLFVNSGSEANDIAWRMAKLATRAGGALVIRHAYHGITDAVTPLSTSICRGVATHVAEIELPGAGLPAGTDPARDGEAAIRAALAQLAARGLAPAALIIDSGLTSSGIHDPPPAWAQAVVAGARAAGALVIGDEVQFGFGRSGSGFWGFERRGYLPDLVTLGKPAGNGYPVGVVITRRELLEDFQKDTGFFSTFGGNPVAGAAGSAVLDVIEEENLQANAQVAGEQLRRGLRELAARHQLIAAVRGAGLLTGVELRERPQPAAPAGQAARDIANRMRERGILIGTEGIGGRVLKLRPPMPFTTAHADQVVTTLDEVLAALP